jgi:hypothetical protein
MVIMMVLLFVVAMIIGVVLVIVAVVVAVPSSFSFSCSVGQRNWHGRSRWFRCGY